MVRKGERHCEEEEEEDNALKQRATN